MCDVFRAFLPQPDITVSFSLSLSLPASDGKVLSRKDERDGVNIA